MADLRKCLERAMLNAGDLTMVSQSRLMLRISGAVNLLYGADYKDSEEISGYTNKQVAAAKLIMRCLTYLAKTNTRIDVDKLIERTSELNRIY